VLMLAAGTPMLLMGDEARRTQDGNNNGYCRDDETNWFDWTLVEQHPDLHRFVRELSGFRQRRDIVAEGGRLSLADVLERAAVVWHGITLNEPDWSEHSRSLALTVQSVRARIRLHLMLNAYWEPLTFELPPPADGRTWRRCIDTARASPGDIQPWPTATEVTDQTCTVQPRSIVVLAQRLDAQGGG